VLEFLHKVYQNAVDVVSKKNAVDVNPCRGVHPPFVSRSLFTDADHGKGYEHEALSKSAFSLELPIFYISQPKFKV
jgi:hypothetical protein